MGQSPSALSGRGCSRSQNGSSSLWAHPGIGLDLGFLLGGKSRPGDEKLDLASWMWCFLLQRLPQPNATVEETADAGELPACPLTIWDQIRFSFLELSPPSQWNFPP